MNFTQRGIFTLTSKAILACRKILTTWG
jgi:hypothetical protein